MADISVKGLSELNKFLQELPGKMEANVVAGGLRAGANVFRDAIRENIPVESGLTKKDIKVSLRKDRKTGLVTSKVSFRKRSHIARFIEYGTKPHMISVAEEEKAINKSRSRKLGKIVRVSMSTINRNALRFGNTYASAVNHPGARPKPFMRPAFDGYAKAATYAFGAYIRKRLQAKHGIDTSDVLIGDEE